MSVQEQRCDWENLKSDDSTFVKSEDLVDYTDQTTGVWGPAPSGTFGVPTIDAVAARSDAYVQPNLPPTVSYQQPGKNWENTDACWTSYWNPEAKAWVAYVNTGPRGNTGPEGGPGPVGPQGPRGDGLTISGSINVPGPPTANGTIPNELILDSNGVGWVWETNGNTNTWVNIGTMTGPPGPPGVAANINVGTTTTGAAGTNAEVVNVGSISSALLNFTIPQGATGPKGDPGAAGGGNLDGITGNTPIFVDNTDVKNPIIYLNFSQLTTLP
jgi:hypothetical protein